MVLVSVQQGATLTMPDTVRAEDAHPNLNRCAVSYGSCDFEQNKVQTFDEFLDNLSDADDGNEDDLSFSSSDEEVPPPPPPFKTPSSRQDGRTEVTSCSRIRLQTFLKSPPLSQSARRRVTFKQEQTSLLSPPSKSPDFRKAWRQKSTRRVSARMGKPLSPLPSKRKTAKEHWAILREHVLSGRFFLDKDFMDRTYHDSNQAIKGQSLRAEIEGGLEWTCGQCLCAIALYLGTAILCFNFLIPETRHEWTIIDSMYFAVATFTTIGFGDLTPPDTHLARLLTCGFALSGVACLGLAVGVLGQHLVDLQSKAMHYCERDVMTLFASIQNDEGELQPCEIHQHELQRESSFKLATSCGKQMWHRLGGQWFLQQYQAMESFLHPPTPYSSFTCAPCTTNACKRRKESYEKRLSQREHSRFFQRINLKFGVFLVLLLVLSYWIGHDAGWGFSQTLYFAITTSCTIGYGDKVPTSQVGRLGVVAFIPFAVGAMGYFLRQLAELIVQAKQQRHMGMLFGTIMDATNCRRQQRELTVVDLEAMDADGDGNVDWSEFLEFMLVAMKKVDEDLLWELRYQFDSLDVDDTGVLSKQNLICMARQKLRQSSHKMHLRQYKQQLLKKTNSSLSVLHERRDFSSVVIDLMTKNKNAMDQSASSWT
ncbi:Two pore potassium channel [Seminavis robusta]|uniref:Two pore potassium channel n=1 Tax=Seminavis robusta TaxID=568900 RepID=A0A9N8HG51_9STRA|nr:Two pore potassium channel [Seminavis robusta]|eukprot:Sro465_g148570.1 Two pore potassium channel (652) ;mRNA; r:22676-24631